MGQAIRGPLVYWDAVAGVFVQEITPQAEIRMLLSRSPVSRSRFPTVARGCGQIPDETKESGEQGILRSTQNAHG